MHLINQIITKLRNIKNKIVRPSKVLYAQRQHLKKFPECVACGSLVGGQAHHIKPYHKFPEFASDPKNFITLCENFGGLECHLQIGHSGSFKCFNPNVIEDAKKFRKLSWHSRQILLEDIKTRRLLDS